MKTQVHRPSARLLALTLLGVTLLVAATIAAAFTREADSHAARANAGSRPLVVVAGAAGDAGELFARRAVADGLTVRALTRDTARERETVSGHHRWLRLDIRNAASVREAVRGAEFVVCWIGAQSGEGPESGQFVGYRGLLNLIGGARAAGVTHFVLVNSAASESYRDPSQQPRLGYVLPWKGRAEEHLRESGLTYTIIDQAGLRSDAGSSVGLRAVRREDYRSMTVSRDDVARVAVDALRNPAARNKSFALFNDVAAAPEAWRRELQALRRDALSEAALRARNDVRATANGSAVPATPRLVVPHPSRDRLMIEGSGAGSQAVASVGWTRPVPARSAPAQSTPD